MSNIIDSLERAQLRQVPRFKAGDTVRVHFQVIEGQRRRVRGKRYGHGGTLGQAAERSLQALEQASTAAEPADVEAVEEPAESSEPVTAEADQADVPSDENAPADEGSEPVAAEKS